MDQIEKRIMRLEIGMVVMILWAVLLTGAILTHAEHNAIKLIPVECEKLIEFECMICGYVETPADTSMGIDMMALHAEAEHYGEIVAVRETEVCFE